VFFVTTEENHKSRIGSGAGIAAGWRGGCTQQVQLRLAEGTSETELFLVGSILNFIRSSH
jgi:hypothetical protein